MFIKLHDTWNFLLNPYRNACYQQISKLKYVHRSENETLNRTHIRPDIFKYIWIELTNAQFTVCCSTSRLSSSTASYLLLAYISKGLGGQTTDKASKTGKNINTYQGGTLHIVITAIWQNDTASDFNWYRSHIPFALYLHQFQDRYRALRK